ncbi:MAG: TonB-dependent hemoglobin/transferrin/lactoferrin family receptor [Cyanobacteria bacterium P01_F01_bin.143]
MMKHSLLTTKLSIFLIALATGSVNAAEAINTNQIQEQDSQLLLTPDSIAQAITEVINIELQDNNGDLQIILETTGEANLIPLMMSEGNDLIIELMDANLALPTGETFQEISPLPGIVEVTAQTVEDNIIRLTITGENQTPSAEIISSDPNLILTITPQDGTREVTRKDYDESDITVTVTGTRTPRPVLDSSNSIVVIDSERIDREIARDIRDLVRYEPGVSVGRNPNRFGNQGFNIRGIDENRVLILVDGVRIPDNYVGRGRDYFDLETIERVEIIKGPASALYGSDAIGGVVSVITKDPEDYLKTFDNSVYTSISTKYGSVNEGITTTGVVAAEDEEGKIQTSLAFTVSNSSEFKNDGSIRANPQDVDDLTLTGKVVYNINDNNSLKFTGELFNSETDTDVINEQGTTPFDVSNPPFFVFFDRQDVEATDTRERRRIGLNYDYDNPNASWLQAAKVNFYYQDAQIEEDKISSGIRQDITPFGPPTFTPVIRDEENSFDQDVFGGDVQLESNFFTGSVDHRLVYGFEIFNTDTSRPRDNTLINLIDGSTSKFVVGEEFPNKTFPDTSTLRAAIYIQDEIEIGKVTLIPGLRWDYYSLDANEDDDFARINVDNFEVEDINESAFSPKLGVIYKPVPELSLYAQYARGFRSPPYDDANIGFTNFAFSYTVLPNADLDPETTDSFEVGFRGSYPAIDFGVAGFYNDYDDFIDTVRVGTRASDGFSQFQSQNIEKAEIYGVEAKAEYFFNPSRESGFSLIASLAWAEGNNTSDGDSVPLNTVNPIEAIVGLRYRALENRWGTELIGTIVGEKDRVDGDDLFTPDGFFTLDLLSFYNISENVSLNLGLFNLLNEQYFIWSDVEELTNDDPNLDRNRQPAFNAAASIRVRF